MLLISGIYSLVKNYYQNDCFTYPELLCGSTEVIFLSLANKSKSFDLLTEQAWVNFASAMAILIATHVYRRAQNLTEKESMRGLESPANYTIMINNIPPGKYNDTDIQHLLVNNWKKREGVGELKVKKIVQAYFIGDYVSLLRMKNQLTNEKRKYMRFQKQKGSLPQHANMEEINEKINDISNKIQESAIVLRNNLEKTCGSLFVTFNTIGMAQAFLKRYKISRYARYKSSLRAFCCSQTDFDNIIKLDEKTLFFEQAKDPNDILWENLGYSYKEKLKKRFITLIATLFLLAICFGLIWAISYGKVDFSIKKQIKFFRLASH